MNLIRISPPAALPLSLAEVKALAGLEGLDESEDARIAAYLRAAVERVEGPDGWIQRALITQTWALRLDAFPGTLTYRPGFIWRGEFCPTHLEIELPLPPLQSVTSITYLSGGVEETLDTSAYQVAGIGDRNKARLRPAVSWPTTDDIADAVMITFVAGYGDSWNDVPEVIRQAITLMVQGFYDGCESEAATHLLRPYRVDLSLA